jgi:hypothetical protein
VASVRIPSLLALEAGGVQRHDVEATTVREAIIALPVADLLIDELGSLRPLLHIYVQGHRQPDLEAPLAPDADIIVVAAVAGG